MEIQNLVSIIVPCYNEENYIDNCIKSLLNNDYPTKEIVIVEGGSTDKSIEIINKLIGDHNIIRIINNKDKITPKSLNIGITQSRGSYVMIASAHSSYPINYISELMTEFVQSDADVVGGILITTVKNSNRKSNSIAYVLSHPFGVGNSDFRIGSVDNKYVDTVPFGIYQKDVFNKFGLYNELLIRNHDIELNKRIVNNGGKILLAPKISCNYYCRENFVELARNNFQNGVWNILTVVITKDFKSLSFRHFVPLGFVISLFFSFFIGVIIQSKLFILLGLTIIGAYLLALILAIFIKKSNAEKYSILHIIYAFLTLHFSYGVGSLIGIIKSIKYNRE